MKFVYYKSLHWLGLNYRLIPFITGFIIFVFNIVLNNSDVFCMWDSWFTSSGPTEEDIASRAGVQNTLAEQAVARAKSSRKELELAGFEYPRVKTGARNIDSFTPEQKAQMTCEESIKNFRKSIARETAIKKSHKLATAQRGTFDFLREIKVPTVREVKEEVAGQSPTKPVLGSRHLSRTTIAAATEEAAGETLKWAQFTQLVCNKKR